MEWLPFEWQRGSNCDENSKPKTITFMQTFLKTLESKLTIHYHDCDPFNHLNNSRYIDYMVAARTEQLLENYGLNASELAKTRRS